MRYLTTIVALLLMAGLAWGQAGDMEIRPGNDVMVTSDSTDTDTVNIGLFSRGMQGFPQLWVYTDIVKASGECDSVSLRYRPATGGAKADTFASMGWKSPNIWQFGTADVAFTNFAITDAAWYHVLLEFDGEIPSYLQIEVATIGNEDSNDSLETRIILKDALRNLK